MTTAEAVLQCQGCGNRMNRVEEIRDNGVVIDLYRCPVEECGRKIAMIFEPLGGYSEEEQSFIQREIARRGAFFPSDYFGNRGLRR